MGPRAKNLPDLAEAGIPMITMHFREPNDRQDQQTQLANTVSEPDRSHYSPS